MTLYLVSVARWNGKGNHKQKSVSITERFDVAQKLMVERMLHLTEREGQLVGKFLTFHNKFDEKERTTYFDDLSDYRTVLDKLIEQLLASETEIRIPRGQRGFCLKIKEVPYYDETTADMAPTVWEIKWKEDLEKKLDWAEERLSKFQ